MSSDESLMEEVSAGHVAAFQLLYDRHHRAVFHFFLRFLGDRHTAEDLLQETFLRMFAHRGEYRARAAFKAWLFTIARNLALDHLRRQRGSPAREGVLETVVDPKPSPLEHAEVRELDERLQALVLILPTTEREVLLLSRFAGLSHEEVAEVTGASLGAVRVALHRALRRIRELLGPV
ncbi:MAG: RNA polymerase sigma factor [Candidatus Methylomirabilia bacterium]